MEAWNIFICGKRDKKDVIQFQSQLSDNVINLHNDLISKRYKHSSYFEFNINDPKPRTIHKASVRDRIVHHLIYKELYWCFDKKFVYDSYSCRKFKGTHRALNRFRDFSRKVSKNNTKTCYVLKCDIRKFFASIDQKKLSKILKRHITDKNMLWLLHQIIYSFDPDRSAKGMPLGNLTSQLLTNVYMHEFDMFVKQGLRIKYYIRYADDFVFLSDSRDFLVGLIPQIRNFLENNLKLELHPKKVYIKTVASGVDFLGWIHFSHHRKIRNVTKYRILRKLEEKFFKFETTQSYLGLLKHGNTHRLQQNVLELVDYNEL